jgi:hypothetical protein
MRIILCLLFSIRLFTASAQYAVYLWSRHEGITLHTHGYGVAADSKCNIYSTGGFDGPSVYFGNVLLTRNGSIGRENFFLAKYDSSGNVLWAKTGNGEAISFAVSVDKSDNVCITGTFYGPTLEIGTTTLSATNNPDGCIYTAKFDPQGNLIWAKTIAGSGGGDESWAIANDRRNNVYITGCIRSDTVNFGGAIFVNTSKVQYRSAFVAKYDSAGNFIWGKMATAGYMASSCGNDVASDLQGNVILTGYFADTSIAFGGITLNKTSGALVNDYYMIKMDSAGNALWGKNCGGSAYNNRGEAVTADKNGNIYITGVSSGQNLKLGNIQLSLPYPDNIFIAKFDPQGTALWARTCFGSPSIVQPSGIAIDSGLNVVVAGEFWSNGYISFDGMTNLTSSSWDSDIFISKYDSLGIPVWATNLGNTGYDYAHDVSCDPESSIIIVGQYDSPSLSIGPINYPKTGNVDYYIAKLRPMKLITGIAEHSKDADDFVVYPNPGRGTIYIKARYAIKKLTITNVLGEVVLESQPGSESSAVRLEKNGMYFATIISGEKTWTKALIVSD